MPSLEQYNQKRDFTMTAEPAGKPVKGIAAAGRSLRHPQACGDGAFTTICGSNMAACCGAGR